MLKAGEDFFPAIAHYFVQPNAAVNRDEQGSLVKACWLCVCNHRRIYEVIPDFEDFGFELPLIDPEFFQDLGHDLGC